MKASARARKPGINASALKGIELHNFYIPAGGDEPDVETNPRFAHKMEFLARTTDYFAARNTSQDKIVILGDFNIAPYEHDVWSHKQLLKVVSHTPGEVDALNAMLAAGDFIDVAREIIPEPEKIYTWWSYRSKDYRASNRGRRLDHIWVTPALKDAALAKGRDGFRIYEPERGKRKAVRSRADRAGPRALAKPEPRALSRAIIGLAFIGRLFGFDLTVELRAVPVHRSADRLAGRCRRNGREPV
jgi:hypothetical protein